MTRILVHVQKSPQHRSRASESLKAPRTLCYNASVRELSVTQSAKECPYGALPSALPLMPIQRLATTSIVRRGTISLAQRQIIAATRLHKGASVCAHDDAAATTLPCVGVAYRAYRVSGLAFHKPCPTRHYNNAS
jgi:hypothetical protein